MSEAPAVAGAPAVAKPPAASGTGNETPTGSVGDDLLPTVPGSGAGGGGNAAADGAQPVVVPAADAVAQPVVVPAADAVAQPVVVAAADAVPANARQVVVSNPHMEQKLTLESYATLADAKVNDMILACTDESVIDEEQAAGEEAYRCKITSIGKDTLSYACLDDEEIIETRPLKAVYRIVSQAPLDPLSLDD